MRRSLTSVTFTCLLNLILIGCGSENSSVAPIENPPPENPAPTQPANRTIDSMSLEASAAQILTGDSVTLSATWHMSDNTTQAVTDIIIWQSSNPAVIQPTVTSGSNTFVGRQEGSTTITASSGDFSSTITITVSDTTTPPELTEPTNPTPTPDPETPVITFPDSGVMLFTQKPSSWNDVYIYIWQDGGSEPRGSWPGERLSAYDDNGWYTTTITTNEFSGNAPNFIINDGATNKTPDITDRTTSGWLDANTGNWSDVPPSNFNGTLEESPTPPQNPMPEPVDPPPPSNSDFTLFFEAPSNWTAVYIYIWKDGETATRGGWPGEQLSATSNWYFTDITDNDLDGDVVNVIFNDGDSQQTANLTRASTGYYQFSSQTWFDADPNGDRYTLAVIGGTASATGEVVAGQRITLTAFNPDPGFAFIQWDGADSSYLNNPTSSTTTLTMPESDVTIRAIFALEGDEFALGRSYYQEQCARCHGANGDGTSTYPALNTLSGRYTQQTLANRIESTMPPAFASGPDDCTGTCATETAKVILANQYKASAACNEGLTPSDRQLRLLSRSEYKNSIKDITGADIDVSAVPDTSRFEGFDNSSRAAVTESHVSAYKQIAEELGNTLSLQNIVSQYSNCGSDRRCQVKTFGLHSFRRPLTNSEENRYLTLYDNTDGGAVITAMLSSAAFLYRSEVGTRVGNPGSEINQQPGYHYYQLDDYEIASLISYTYWGSTPDQTLLDAAANGQLSNDTQRQQLMRNHVLVQPEAKSRFGDFVQGWLDISDIGDRAHISDSLAEAFINETKTFVSSIAFDENGDLADVYVSNFTYLNSTLVNNYGFGQANSANQFVKNNYVEGQRKGLIGHGSILSKTGIDVDQPNIITRGLFVRENLLCQDLGNPPPNAGNLPDPDTLNSTREFFAAHDEDPGCSFCHQYIDPIGFGTENFDGLGRFRSQETFNNNVNLLSGEGTMQNMEIDGAAAGNGETVNFSHISGLADLLANSANAKSCYVTQYFRYMTGEHEQDDYILTEDTCTIDALSAPFANGNVSLKDQLVAMTQSAVFAIRKSRQ